MIAYTALSSSCVKSFKFTLWIFSTSFLVLKYILQLIYKEIEDVFAELKNELVTAFVSVFCGITVLRTEIMHGFELISSFYK